MQSENRMKSDGIFSAIKSLREKLAQLQRWQNEKEQNRGFSEGGTSQKSPENQKEDKDIGDQISFLEEQLTDFERQKSELSDEQDHEIQTNENIAEEQNAQSLEINDLEIVAEKYRAWGIDCEVGVLGSGEVKITVKNPGNFEGANLLEMSQDNLEKMVNEIGGDKPSASCSAIEARSMDKEKSRDGGVRSF